MLLSVVDHYNRAAKDTRKRVVGVLLGEMYKGQLDITNSFAGKDPSPMLFATSSRSTYPSVNWPATPCVWLTVLYMYLSRSIKSCASCVFRMFDCNAEQPPN